jgi:hypothetical protein
VTVHHVAVDDARAGIHDFSDLVAQVSEIGAQD